MSFVPFRTTAACALAIACAPGCRQLPPTSPSPVVALPAGLTTRIEHWPGSTLTGPQLSLPAAAVEKDDANAPDLRLSLRILALDGWPQAGEPLGQTSRIVFAPAVAQPIEVFPRTMGEGRWIGPEESTDFVDNLLARHTALLAGAYEGPLVPGLVTTLTLSAVEEHDDPDNYLGEYKQIGAVYKEIKAVVSRPLEGPASVAIGLTDMAPTGEDDDFLLSDLPASQRYRPGALMPKRELVLSQQHPSSEEGPWVALLPSPFRCTRGPAYAIIVEVQPVPEEQRSDHRAAAKRLVANSQRRLEDQRQVQAALLRQDTDELALTQAIAALDPSSGVALRAPLVYLAEASQAHLATNLALTAEAQQLEDWVTRIRTYGEVVDIGWTIERCAYLELADQALRSDLPPALEGALLHHAGEVGRFPSMLRNLAEASPDFEQFERRLVIENRAFLEDSHPSARVRAFEWLQVRALAPVGFDPLADRDTRRASLEAATQAPTRSNEEEITPKGESL